MTREEVLSSSVSMKVGVNYCLSCDKRVAIYTDSDGNAYGAPHVEKNKTYVPLKALLDRVNVAYTENKGVFEIAGKSVKPVSHTDRKGHTYPVIEIGEIESLIDGWYLTYDNMGLIVVAREPKLLDRHEDLNDMLGLIRKFVFDFDGVDNIYNDIVKTTGQKHPYVIIKKDRFDLFRRLYKEYLDYQAQVKEATDKGQEPPLEPKNYLLMKMIGDNVREGKKVYAGYAKPTKPATDDAKAEYEKYIGLLDDKDINSLSIYGGISLVQPNLIPEELRTEYKKENDEYVLDENGNRIVSSVYGFDEYGYDAAGGRMNIDTRLSPMRKMAFAYQITGNLDYVRCIYDAFVRVGEWLTWGTGHFLSLGDGGATAGIIYDWMYDGIEKLGGEISAVTGEPYSADVIRKIIYDKIIYESYRVDECRLGNKTWASYDMPVAKGYTAGTDYHDRTNNWSAVCTSGVGISSLSILDGGESEEIRNTTLHVLSTDFYYLTKGGINMYAPDGSYHEGPSYWAYGTNKLFEYCMVLDTVCGTNYGIMEAAGVPQTAYFALYDENNDGKYFNFNDSGLGSQNTSSFFYVGQYYGDSTLIKVRMNQLNEGLKKPNLFDMYWYPIEDVEDGESKSGLDYYTEQIDLFTARKSFDRGALFAGMIGGKNNTSHNHVDALTFAVYNSDNCWLMDIGTERYNAIGFWGPDTRFRYYKMKPEGHNTIAVASKPDVIPFGQDKFGYAKAYEWSINEMAEGAYAKFDGTPALGGVAKSWKRGMLLTNDRNTVVVQDELTFNEEENAYWSAHYSSDFVKDVEISEDGRRAYMYSAVNDAVLRVALVSEDESLRFEIWDTYSTVHQRTDDKNSPYFVHEKNYNPDFYTYDKEEFHPIEHPHGQLDRGKYKKLFVRAEERAKVNMAVVIEEIDKNNESSIGYSWCSMDSDGWKPKRDER